MWLHTFNERVKDDVMLNGGGPTRRRLTERRHSVKTVDYAEVVKLGAVVNNGVAERLKVLMLQDVSSTAAPGATPGAAPGLGAL